MFTNARIKLTAWYLISIMSISLLFSFIIFKVESIEIDRFEKIQRLRIERRLQDRGLFFPNNQNPPPFPTTNIELLEETKKRLLIMLGILNLGIFVLAGGLGYMLAGRTLKPIKNMVLEQNQFISDASHELRTPLTSLKSAFEVYLRNKNPDISESKILVKESIVEVNKLQSLSDSLLQLAQYQKPNGNMTLVKTSLHQIITNAINKMKLIADKKNIKITYGKTKIEVIGNTYGLTDVIVILLDNAIKYSPKNSNIQIKIKEKAKLVVIEIVDHGIGIEKKDLPHIFNRFYRADLARQKVNSGGYGLGLAIAKKIMENHQGKIYVSSKINKGSAFFIELPVA